MVKGFFNFFRRLRERLKRRPKPRLKPKKIHELYTNEVREEVSLKKYGLSYKTLEHIARMRKKGELIYNISIRGDKIRYFKKYRRWVAPKGVRLAIWEKPVLIAGSPTKARGPVSERVIASRHNVFRIKAGRRGRFMIAKKTFVKTKYKAAAALKEFVSLVEAKRRGIAVVEPLRVDVNWITNSGTLYTMMFPGFKDLSTFGLTKKARTEKVIKELARQIGQMHLKGMFHGDLRRPNILWNGNTNEPKIILLDLETARFYEGKLPISKAIEDILLLTESLCGKWQGIGRFTKEEMNIFAEEYCKITGYEKGRILYNIERAIPRPEERTVADYLRARLERRSGLR